MKEKISSQKKVSRTISSLSGQRKPFFPDQRPEARKQTQLIESIRKKTNESSLTLGWENAGKPSDFVHPAFFDGYTRQRIKKPEPPSVPVMQRRGEDIQAIWGECVALITVPQGRRLNPNNKADVEFVLRALEREGHWTPYQDLIRRWNFNQSPDLRIQGGTPTEQDRREHPEDPEREDIAFLGSDSNPRDTDQLPGNILAPAIAKFRQLATEAAVEGIPIHMASYLSRVQRFYGDKVEGSSLSQVNLDMLTEINQKRASVLLLHPKVELTHATREERDRILAFGYQPDLSLWGNRGVPREVRRFDLPVLYRHPEGQEINEAVMNILHQIALDYITNCQNYIDQRDRERLNQRGRKRGGASGRNNPPPEIKRGGSSRPRWGR